MTGTPKRVQLSRKRGWRMPPNTVKVDRSTRWGNPNLTKIYGQAGAVRSFRCDLLGGVTDVSVEDVRRDLRGRDLACWCDLCTEHKNGKPLGCHCAYCAPCHADVLLEVANTAGAEALEDA